MNHKTFLFTFLTIISHIWGITDAGYFDYKYEDFNLTEPTTTFSWKDNATVRSFTVLNPDADTSLFVWIENMSCSVLQGGDTSLPNYLKFESDSKAVQLKFWTFCKNVTESDINLSVFNNGFDHVGLTKVKVSPVGLWSDEENHATLRFEIRRHKKFIISDEMTKLELNLKSKSNDSFYEVKLDQGSDFCKTSITESALDNEASVNCSLIMVATKMNFCPSKTAQKTDLLVHVSERDGKKESFSLCETVEDEDKKVYSGKSKETDETSSKKWHNTASKGASFVVIQSLDSIIFQSFGSKVDTALSFSPQLSMNKSSSSPKPTCSEGYFNCFDKSVCKTSDLTVRDAVSCIPYELTCDGRPNCPAVCPNADEDKSFCKQKLGYGSGQDGDDDDYCDDCEGYFYYTGGFSIWQSIFGFLFFLTGFIIIGMAIRAIYNRSFAMRPRPRTVQPYTPPTVSNEVMKARMAPPPSYGEVTRGSYA